MAAPKTFRVNFALALSLLFSALLVGACGGSDALDSNSSGGDGPLEFDEGLDQVIELYEEMFDVLVKVADEASAVDAVDALLRISSGVENLEERMGSYSNADIARSSDWNRFLNIRRKIRNELERISADPAAFKLVDEASE